MIQLFFRFPQQIIVNMHDVKKFSKNLIFISVLAMRNWVLPVQTRTVLLTVYTPHGHNGQSVTGPVMVVSEPEVVQPFHPPTEERNVPRRSLMPSSVIHHNVQVRLW